MKMPTITGIFIFLAETITCSAQARKKKFITSGTEQLATTISIIMSGSKQADKNLIQSTLVISKSKGLLGILRDILTSTYQICGIEENNKSNNHI